MTPETLKPVPISSKERYKRWYAANRVEYNRKRRERYRNDGEYRNNIKVNNYYAATHRSKT